MVQCVICDNDFPEESVMFGPSGYECSSCSSDQEIDASKPRLAGSIKLVGVAYLCVWLLSASSRSISSGPDGYHASMDWPLLATVAFDLFVIGWAGQAIYRALPKKTDAHFNKKRMGLIAALVLLLPIIAARFIGALPY